MKKSIIILTALLLSLNSFAQKWSISTNALDYVDFATLNIEGTVAVSRHIVLDVGIKYNPWTFGNKSVPSLVKQARQRTFYAGIKWYPWFIYDGWHINAMAGYKEYNVGGIFKQQTEEGDAFGGGISGGYTLPIHKNLNLDFTAGLWVGHKNYTVYSCPVCGRVENSGSKVFVMPNDVAVSLTWVFGGQFGAKKEKKSARKQTKEEE